MFVATVYFSNQARKAFRVSREELGNVNADLQESISGVREVQAFNREDENIENFRRSNAANRDANVRAASFTSALNPTLEALGYVAIGIVVIVGGLSVLRNEPLLGTTLISLGTVFAFVQYVQRFTQPITQIAVLWANIQNAIAGGERIFNILDTPLDLTEKPDAKPMPPIKGKVEFDHVEAGYKTDQPVLKGINFVAAAGTNDRHRRTDGRGQDHDHQPDPALLRRDRRRGSHRRHRRARRDLRKPAQPNRPRASGHVPVLGHGDEQHPLRQARRDRRRSDRGGEDGRGGLVHRAPAGRLPDDPRRARQRLKPRAAPVDRHRPCRA